VEPASVTENMLSVLIFRVISSRAAGSDARSLTFVPSDLRLKFVS
jgi:hypothetical protein